MQASRADFELRYGPAWTVMKAVFYGIDHTAKTEISLVFHANTTIDTPQYHNFLHRQSLVLVSHSVSLDTNGRMG